MEESHKEHWEHKSPERNEHPHAHAHARSSEYHEQRASKEQPRQSKKEGRDNFWKITTVVLVVLLAFLVFRNPAVPTGATGGTVADPSPEAPTPSLDVESLIDDDAVLGDEDAPVTIIEWSDYQCPFCKRFHDQTWNLLKSQYIDTGKVKFVYRDFPLSFHVNAQKSAEAAECAGEQGKYWEMHDAIFTQSQADGTGISPADLKNIAKSVGLDSSKFDSCLDSGEMAAEVQKDMSEGAASGVQGTPGFLINGKLVSGAQPFSVFQQVIDSELN